MSKTSDENNSFSGYWLKIAGTATIVLVTIIISMTSFWMMIGKDYITRDETRIIVENEIEPVQAGLDRYSVILQKNTDAVIDLKLSLTALGSLDAMNKRLEFLEGELRVVREEQIKRANTLDSVTEIKNEIKDIKNQIAEIKESMSRSH